MFTYISTDTRPTGADVLTCMIGSARRASVLEDFHVYTNKRVLEANRHLPPKKIPSSHPMYNLLLVKHLSNETDYAYYVWLASNAYFVRNPDVPNFEGMPLWYVDEGLWAIHRDCIDTVIGASDDFDNLDHCLTHLTESWKTRPSPESIQGVYGVDWRGAFDDRLPDGKPWSNAADAIGSVNPTIVRAIHSENAMVAAGQIPIEPVGDKLTEILARMNLHRPSCPSCYSWMVDMNRWGITGCLAKREQIKARIMEASRENDNGDPASWETRWINTLVVMAHGYLSSDALLDEAIELARLSSQGSLVS